MIVIFHYLHIFVGMKKVLSILGLLCIVLLLSPDNGFRQEESTCITTEESQIKDADGVSQHKMMLIELSNELKESSCLTARTLQITNNIWVQRLTKSSYKLTELIRIKEHNELRKVSETVTAFQTINHSTLLCRAGYHIYGLRKIII